MNLVFLLEANDLETCFTYEVKYCYIEKKMVFPMIVEEIISILARLINS